MQTGNKMQRRETWTQTSPNWYHVNLPVVLKAIYTSYIKGIFWKSKVGEWRTVLWSLFFIPPYLWKVFKPILCGSVGIVICDWDYERLGVVLRSWWGLWCCIEDAFSFWSLTRKNKYCRSLVCQVTFTIFQVFCWILDIRFWKHFISSFLVSTSSLRFCVPSLRFCISSFISSF